MPVPPKFARPTARRQRSEARAAVVSPLAGPESCTAVQQTDLIDFDRKPSSPRPISTGLLRALPHFQIRPINLVVFQGSYPLEVVGELILRSASRLDAFSGYPVRT